MLELRTLGQTYEQIGADPQVQLDKSNVKRQLDKALDELAADQADQAGRLKALAYGRLEKVVAKAMLLALGGNIKAMNQVVRTIQAQAALLGFAAPIKHAQTDPTGNEERMPPGTYMLPSVPGVSLADWQAQAEAVWDKQREREASL